MKVIWLQTVSICAGNSPCPDLSWPQFCRGYPCMHNACHSPHCWCNPRGFCSPQTTRGKLQTQQQLLCSPHKAQTPGKQPDKLRVPPGSMLAPAVRMVNQLQHGREPVNSQGPLLYSLTHLHATCDVPAMPPSPRAVMHRQQYLLTQVLQLRMLHAAPLLYVCC